jgi:hypothetical protein
MTTTRRTFLKSATAGLVAMVAGAGQLTRALTGAPGAQPLLAGVTAACLRLAPLGWRQLLLDATGGQLDISAANLNSELTRPLSQIDRNVPGFGDFNLAATRAIEAGSPDRSLLYHAFASSAVVAGWDGTELRGFPTLSEIEAVENYVYGVRPPTMASLRQRAAGHPLGLVVFALQYEDAPNSVQGCHAELCFARAGIARLGTMEPLYDPRSRSFISLDPARPFDFRVVPRRFAAYLAVQMKGADSSGERFGPQDPMDQDRELQFWVPIHKLFNGPECIADLDLDVALDCGLRNDELAMFHKWLDLKGLKNNWRAEDLEQYPFLIKNEQIGSLARNPEFGSGLLVPRPQPFIQEAKYKGKLLTFPVDGRYTGDPVNIQLSSLQVLPGFPPGTLPHYGVEDASQDSQRPAPEYINIRHRVLPPDDRIENLNELPEIRQIIEKGGYDALHYIDGAGDGWVEAHCPQLDGIDAHVPAYCMVSLPDFFPKVKQRDLMLWWNNEVPKPVRDALWAIPPLALSQTRIAANVTLPIGFSVDDVTVPAIVKQLDLTAAPGRQTREENTVQRPNGPVHFEKTGMPDGSPGLFDPGWDTSQGIYYSAPAVHGALLQKFLAGYGLGSPFIEDTKLCAALGAYWPGVAPDATRTFQPDKQIAGRVYPYPSVAPLTDEEIGIAPLPDGRFMPWDGVRGPQARTLNGKRYAAYTDAWRTDYIDLVGTMTAALTSKIDLAEYKARIMAMEAVYWGLGIHDSDFRSDFREDQQTATEKVLSAKAEWAVLSFRIAAATDPELMEAERVAGVCLSGPRLYFFHVYRWEGKEFPDPGDQRIVLVKMAKEVMAYVGGTEVLLKREGQPWIIDRSMPT